MEILKGANNFAIENLYASDGNGGKDVVAMALFKDLVNAACLGAGHQSDERYDAPKCHPETRAAVINDIMSWVNAKVSKEPIMWMSGPAGAGKSAIAQTVCEKCHREKKLLASFFFSRTAIGTGRSEGKRLVPTITCQMATIIPEVKAIIIKQLENDPTILTSSMEIQLQKLVLEPLANMDMKIEQDKSCAAKHDNAPHVVVIDGLDECNDPNVQSRIVKIIANSLNKGNVKLQFLIASRPELAIRTSFESIIVKPMCARIILDEKYKPDDDIRTYLLSEFATLKREHTLQKHLLLEAEWPSSQDIDMLVEKSSGQFIYASTVIKYLKNPRRDPRSGLHTIVNLRPSTVQNGNSRPNESPYATLDLLYKHILATSLTGYELYVIVFKILLFSFLYNPSVVIFKSFFGLTLKNLSAFTGITQSELELLLVDLHSLLYIPHIDEMKFYHASFGDFLKDKSRSEEFYISETEAHKYIAQRCLSIILEIRPEIRWDSLSESQKYSVDRFFEHLRNCDFDEELLTMLRSETTLHAVLEFLSKHKYYDSLRHVIIFYFDGRESARQPYWIPRTEKIQEICLAIVKFVEERFLIKMHSVGTLNVDDVVNVVKALHYTALKRPPHPLRRDVIYFEWLGFLLQSSIHGNHLYLNSEKSFLLYKMLVQDTDKDTRRLSYNRNDAYYPLLLKYLLEKIQPSADIDIDSFPCVSKRVLYEVTQNNYNNYNEDLDNIDDLHSAVETFLERCRVLKQQEEEERKQKQKQKEEFRLKQEEELKRKHEEEFRREREEELKRKQEEQQKKRSFGNRIIKTIKDVPSKLKGKPRNR